ncbi:hypothetical protein KF7HA_01128 [Lactococcus lactis]|nr:hypothetical protein [Lactococcus lactis]
MDKKTKKYSEEELAIELFSKNFEYQKVFPN